MNRKGYSFAEVIIAIAIIGLLATAFLQLMTFSYTNLIGTEKFTEALLKDQSIVEEQIDASRFSPPVNPETNYVKVFDVDIPVHLLSVNTTSSGQVKVYLPEQTIVPKIPIIESPPKLLVRNYSGSNISPQPLSISMFNDPYKLFVEDIDITDETENEHLMNVYRWYTSSETSDSESASITTDDYVVVREWNEAKTIVSYSEALDKGFIPNMKEYIDLVTGRKEQYNELDYEILKNAYSFTDEEMINSFGNRYLRYGVTPYSLTGRMGVEELSNVIYIEAPRLEILSAEFEDDNLVIINFNMEIEDLFNTSSIILNELLGEPEIIKRDEDDHTKLILEFTQPIDKSEDLGGNFLDVGAVVSKDYGSISIWYNNYPNSEFTIMSD